MARDGSAPKSLTSFWQRSKDKLSPSNNVKFMPIVTNPGNGNYLFLFRVVDLIYDGELPQSVQFYFLKVAAHHYVKTRNLLCRLLYSDG